MLVRKARLQDASNVYDLVNSLSTDGTLQMCIRDRIDSPQSIVFDQAENRMHAQKALLLLLLGGLANVRTFSC